MVHVVATITLKPNTRKHFAEVFRWLTPQVTAEDGCIEYQGVIDIPTTIHVQDPLRADVVTVIEKWTTLDALYAHLKAPHMNEYRSRVKDYVIGVALQVMEPI